MTASRILIVDDDVNVLRALQRALRKELYEVFATTDPYDALCLVRQYTFATVVSDQRMPALEGTRLLEQIRKHTPETVRILLTGHANVEAALEAINRGAVYRFLTKPWDDDELRRTLQEAVRHYHHRCEERRRERLRELHYQSLIEQVTDGIFVMDLAGYMIEVNSQACTMTGYTRGQLFGLHPGDLLPDLRLRVQDLRRFRDQLRAGQVLHLSQTVQRRDGSRFPAEISVTLVDDAWLQALVRDVTERKHYEAQLIEAKEQPRR